jgi:hypothetical protein
MSKTNRNIPHDRWLRRPKTHGYRRDLLKAQEEIQDELGVNYLKGNFAKIRTIPTAWDDLCIAARDEVDSLDIKLETLYREKILGLSTTNWNNLYHSIEFDSRKNYFRAYRTMRCRVSSKVNYIPFNVTICNCKYPVKLKMEWWYA